MLIEIKRIPCLHVSLPECLVIGFSRVNNSASICVNIVADQKENFWILGEELFPHSFLEIGKLIIHATHQRKPERAPVCAKSLQLTHIQELVLLAEYEKAILLI